MSYDINIFCSYIQYAYVVGCSCVWWAISFTTRIDDVIVDPRILPMNRINIQALQLPSPIFRLLDVDPVPGSFIDVMQGFTLTFAKLPMFSDFSLIRDAVTVFYSSGSGFMSCMLLHLSAVSASTQMLGNAVFHRWQKVPWVDLWGPRITRSIREK